MGRPDRPGDSVGRAMTVLDGWLPRPVRHIRELSRQIAVITGDCDAGVTIMLRWAVIFLVIGLIAGVLGFGGIAGASFAVAKILFFVFMLIFLIFLIGGLTIARRAGGG
jgi:uncharacterized membrane protein YtjA (UPF0391 family)